MAGKKHYSKIVIEEALDLYGQGLNGREVGQKLGVSCTSVNRWASKTKISRSQGGSIYKWSLLIKKRVFARYVNGETVPEIIRDFPGLNKNTVWLWLRKAGVTRNAGAVKGKKNHFWRGGIYKRKYPQNWTITLKESIRQRDNHKCQLCGVPQEECFCALAVHHIDRDKNNLNPENLISLCGQCHGKHHTKLKSTGKDMSYREN